MITLSTTPYPRSVTPQLVDFGIVQRPATGAAVTYIDRPGMRWAATFEMPPMTSETARTWLVNLARGKSEGVRMVFPLAVSQGTPGSTTVNGGTSVGTSLLIKSATPGYQVLAGYWLNVVDASGVYYLHQVQSNVTVGVGGTATLAVWPPLRADLVNGDDVILDTPYIEGLLTEAPSWSVPPGKIVEFGFTVEEAA